MNKIGLLLVIAIIGTFSAACDAAEDESRSTEVQLTNSELDGTANLSAADRASFVDQCVAHRTELFTYLNRGTSMKREELEELKGNIDETFPRFCNCVERGLESSLSKMQFLMAQKMVGQGVFIAYPGTPLPKFEDLRNAAARVGMSDEAFESARQKFRLLASHSAETCFPVWWGPTLARQLGRPELRTYSGPPAAPK
jgi:hypothetical protein